MIQASSLRLGNLILWNPQLTSFTTLTPLVVEVTSVAHDKVGYVSPRIEQRAEPFEDDLLEADAPERPLNEFEPLPLRAELLAEWGFEGGRKGKLELAVSSEEGAGFDVVFSGQRLCRLTCFHELQNLYYSLFGEELPASS
jgi:hypothetical protein